MTTEKVTYEQAIQRLMYQAEIGGWYKEDSTVPVRIGDLYAVFKRIREQNTELVKLKEYTEHLEKCV